jgi:hypothetical protein
MQVCIHQQPEDERVRGAVTAATEAFDVVRSRPALTKTKERIPGSRSDAPSNLVFETGERQ